LRTFRRGDEIIEIEPGGADLNGPLSPPHEGGYRMMQERQGHLGMGSHQSSQMLKDEWLTPPEIIKALGGPESFDLDPCAPIKRPWEMAKEHYTIADNGLLKPWHGRVWFNPPYGGPQIVGPWMRRMAEHGHGTALTFARTETDLFFETVWKRADSPPISARASLFSLR